MSINREIVVLGGQKAVVGQKTGTWKDIVAFYISQKQVTASSRQSYAKALNLFFSWADNTHRDWTRLSKIDILSYIDYLQNDDKRHSSLTVNLYVVAIRGFYEWADNLSHDPHIPNIAKDIKIRHKKNRFEKEALSAAEASRLLTFFRDKVEDAKCATNNVEARYREAMRDYAMVNLMIHTGLRTIEVNRANIEHISKAIGNQVVQNVLYVRGKGKADYDDFIVLTKTTYEPLIEYLRLRPSQLDGDPLFACEGRASRGRRLSTRRIQSIVKTGLRNIGLEEKLDSKYSAHSLRHTAGSLLLEAGGTMFDVQNLLRHASPTTSEIYVNKTRKKQRIDAAPEELLDTIIAIPDYQ